MKSINIPKKIFFVFFFVPLSVLLIISSSSLLFAVPGEKPSPPLSQFDVENYASDILQESTTTMGEFYSETGRISISVDAGGSNDEYHIINVDKPNERAKVKRAYVLAASTGWSYYNIPNGDIQLEGNPINWDRSIPNHIFSYNHLADVTAIIKPIVDAAPAGRIGLTFTESNTYAVDGEILIVVFDDKTQRQKQTVICLFGALNPLGSLFGVTLPKPIDPLDTDAFLDMGLGISYGYQTASYQYNIVEVNGSLLTSSAGGEDDGYGQNGALITVGGLDDSNANPPDPYENGYGNPRYDDELYSLLPLIDPDTTNITIDTNNPSMDDNIFFIYFKISRQADVEVGSLFDHPTNSKQYMKCLYGSLHCAKKGWYHTAIDYKKYKSNQVFATNDGTIARIEHMSPNDHGMGNNIIIEHIVGGEKIYSLYAHLASIDESLYEGKEVSKGEKIGIMGGSGYGVLNYWSTHLHFEIKDSPVTHNPTGEGKYWGYTPGYPDLYGYYDPNEFIGKIAID